MVIITNELDISLPVYWITLYSKITRRGRKSAINGERFSRHLIDKEPPYATDTFIFTSSLLINDLLQKKLVKFFMSIALNIHMCPKTDQVPKSLSGRTNLAAAAVS